jgi:hygromycin-B 7''-O-kinase
MLTGLPRVSSRADFERARSEPLDRWRPAVVGIAARHGLDVREVVRFGAGENPVFDLDGRFVLKLAPILWRTVVERDAECLRFLADAGLPTAALVGWGAMGDWSYLLLSRLPGRPLDSVWIEIRRDEREGLAFLFGQLVARLQSLPLKGFNPARLDWDHFVTSRISEWNQRLDVSHLPARLRESAPEYLARANLADDSSSMAFLHGDLAPENVLVSKIDGRWAVTGVFDFGNALVGRAHFDLAAPTVLLAPGDRGILREFFGGYGWDGSERRAVRSRLMAYTLIHPRAHLPSCLALIPGLARARSWEQVAERFWPD